MENETLWLLKGGPDAKGWNALQADSMSKKVFVLSFDRHAWALVKSVERPDGYEGLAPGVPTDGLYLDPDGRPIYISDGREVHSAKAVVAGLGEDAVELLIKIGDADFVLERLGRAF